MAYRLLRRSVRHYSTFLSRNSSSVPDDPPRLVYRDCPMKSQKNSSALKSPLPLPQTKAETNRKAERFISRAIAFAMKTMQGFYPSFEDYYHLISGLNEEGEIGSALFYFHRMKRVVGIRSDCFYFLVDSLCKIGEFEHALDDAMDMIREGLVPTLTTMKKLVNGLVRISKVDDAKELVEEIKDKFSENGDKWGELEEELPQES